MGLIGGLYAKGQGVPKDYMRAYMWFDLATAGGSEGSGKVRELLKERLTPERIREAQRLADRWLKKHQAIRNE